MTDPTKDRCILCRGRGESPCDLRLNMATCQRCDGTGDEPRGNEND